MDPITAATTAAGLVLGGASLAVQIFQGAVKGFEYFETAVRADVEIQAAKLRLRIEYARLFDWGDLVGLLEQNKHDGYNKRMQHNHTVVVAILSELRATLRQLRDLGLQQIPEESQNTTDFPGLNERLMLRIDESNATGDAVGPAQATKAKLSGLFSLAAAPRTARKRMKGFNHILSVARGVRTVAKQPKRFRWALRDKTKFLTILDKVQQLVDYLHETASDDQMQLLVESSQQTQLAMVTLSDDVQQMKALLEAIKLRLQSPGANASEMSLDGRTLVDGMSVNGHHDVQEVDDSETRFKDFLASVVEFGIRMRTISAADVKAARLSDNDVALLKHGVTLDAGSRTLATVTGVGKVWIEWKSYTPVTTFLPDGTDVRQANPTISKRVEELAALLRVEERPAEFSVPICLGYYVDKRNKRFGFVFHQPRERSVITASDASRPDVSKSDRPKPDAALDPCSLYSMLSQIPIGMRHRISIARQLSECLVYLHAVDWLHKGLRSSSVLFFTDGKSRSPGRAYISGFEYSRRIEGDQTSTGPPADFDWAFYTHPDYQGFGVRKGYRKTYDMYSLGIILIELAYWQSIEEIMGFESSEPVAAPKPDLNGQAVAGASREEQPTHDGAAEVKDPKPLSRDSPEDLRNIRSRILGLSGNKPKPSKDMLDPTAEKTNPTKAKIEHNYSHPILDHVEDTMGPKYRQVVWCCITGSTAFDIPDDQEQSDPIVGALLQQEFIRNVVSVLASIAV